MGVPVAFVYGQDPSTGLHGGASFLRVHALAAVRAGFTPHIFCPADRSSVRETPYGLIHRTWCMPLPPQRQELWGVQKPFIAWYGARLARRVADVLGGSPGPHLVHGFSTWGHVAVLAAAALRHRGHAATAITSVYTTAADECRGKIQGLSHDHGWASRLAFRAEHLGIRLFVDRLERHAYRRSRLILVNYEAVRRLLEGAFGPGPEVRRLPYTAETAFRPPSPRGAQPGDVPEAPPRTPLVVSVSRHDPRKGVDVLLRALAQLWSAGVLFRACLLSGGALLDAHRQLARRLGIADVVALPGWVPDPFPYLQHADVFVLPSLQEASGSLAAIEAMQAGVALVASRLDGIPEDLTDGDDAVLVPPGDAGALAKALGRVLDDPGGRARLAQRARQTFEARFSPQALTRALGDLYAEMLAEAR
jgi:glycosyltransferase involved in cell wall biosynthesis